MLVLTQLVIDLRALQCLHAACYAQIGQRLDSNQCMTLVCLMPPRFSVGFAGAPVAELRANAMWLGSRMKASFDPAPTQRWTLLTTSYMNSPVKFRSWMASCRRDNHSDSIRKLA